MANKYKITQPGEKFHKENGTFHMYVSKCFHWEAYKFLKKLVHDPLAHYEVVQLCDQFDKLEFDDDQDFNEQALVPDEKAEFAYEEMLATASRQNDINNPVAQIDTNFIYKNSFKPKRVSLQIEYPLDRSVFDKIDNVLIL